MPIIRVKKDKDNPYVMINKTILCNKKLSAKAKGIFFYIMSLPDNWNMNVKELAEHFTEGRDVIYKVIRELEKNGYVKKVQRRSKTGNFNQIEYLIFEIPHTDFQEAVEILISGIEPHTDLPDTETDTENPDTDFQELLSINSTNISFLSEKSGKPPLPEKLNAREIVKYFAALYQFYFKAEYVITWGKDAGIMQQIWLPIGKDIFPIIDHYLAVEENSKYDWSTKPRTIANLRWQINAVQQHWKEYA
jgi:predicted transcriptional regulator